MSRGDKSGDVDLGKRLRAMRNAAGVTQEQLGDAIGVTFQQVQKYEKGINRVGARQLDAITKALKCSVADLVGDVGTPSEFGPTMDFVMSRPGQELAKAYMAMSPRRQSAIIGLIRELGE